MGTLTWWFGTCYAIGGSQMVAGDGHFCYQVSSDLHTGRLIVSRASETHIRDII